MDGPSDSVAKPLIGFFPCEPNEQSHPLLQRDYSTIGIGPVFASRRSGPDQPLPITYLSGSDSESTKSFLSSEIVGRIKSCPQDFVVREIGLPGRTIHGLSEDDVESLRVADIHAPRPSLWIEESRSAFLSSAPRQHCGESVTAETELVKMEEVLKEQLELTTEGPRISLEAIDRLNEQAKAVISGEQVDMDDKEVWINPLAVLDRATFHQAFRLSFPLLSADSVSSAELSIDGTKTFKIRITIDDRFQGLASALLDPLDDLLRLHAFFKRRVDRSNLRASTVLKLRPDLSRDERKPLHQTISFKTNNALRTSTVTDHALPDGSLGVAILVQWNKNACRRAANKQKASLLLGGENAYPHTLLVFKKTRIEHLVALQVLQRAFRVPLSDIGLAGIKDMQAVTYQFATIANTSPHRIVRSMGFLKSKHIEIGTIHQADWKLSKGSLSGNRFEVVLRDVRQVRVDSSSGMVKERLVETDMAHVDAMMQRVDQNGFVNFYGTQRVGEPGIPSIVGVRTFEIGRAMLQRDFTKAIDLLMTGRLVSRGCETEPPDILAVREAWKESHGDVSLTYKKLPRNHTMARERIILQGLKRHGKDNPLEALKCLSYNERIFWISAYQSYVFNVMTTRRLQIYGYNVVEGDLVLPTSGRPVKMVSNADCSMYTMDDVVLPLPGHGVQYPRNEVGRLYQQLLEYDHIFFSKDNVPSESTAKGSYRYILRRATQLSCCRTEDGDGLSVKLKFDLPSGSYATMFLRELMLTTVVR